MRNKRIHDADGSMERTDARCARNTLCFGIVRTRPTHPGEMPKERAPLRHPRISAATGAWHPIHTCAVSCPPERILLSVASLCACNARARGIHRRLHSRLVPSFRRSSNVPIEGSLVVGSTALHTSAAPPQKDVPCLRTFERRTVNKHVRHDRPQMRKRVEPSPSIERLSSDTPFSQIHCKKVPQPPEVHLLVCRATAVDQLHPSHPGARLGSFGSNPRVSGSKGCNCFEDVPRQRRASFERILRRDVATTGATIDEHIRRFRGAKRRWKDGGTFAREVCGRNGAKRARTKGPSVAERARLGL